MALSRTSAKEDISDVHLQINGEEQNNAESEARAAYNAAKAARDVVLHANQHFKIAKNNLRRKKSKAKRLNQELEKQETENPDLISRYQNAEAAANQALRYQQQAQKELHKATALSKKANDEFTARLLSIYRWCFAEKFSALLVTTLIFSFYQFKTSIKSANEVAEVWGFNPFSSTVTTPIGIIVTSVDTVFNALLLNLTLETLKDVMKHYEKYGIKSASRIQEFFDLLRDAKQHPRQVPLHLFHFTVKKIHNYASGASYILGIDEWIDPLLGNIKWPFYLAILHLGDIYFRNSQDEKYDNGAKVFWRQMAALSKKAIFEGEVTRALDIVIRGVLAGGVLRGLNFYYIWSNFSKLSVIPRQLSPGIVGLLTLAHALSVRCTRTYEESGLAQQDKLRDIFAQRLIDESLKKLQAEDARLSPEMDADKLRLLALTQTVGTETFFHLPEDASLSDAVIEKISRKLLLEKAGKLSRAYSHSQKKILASSIGYKERIMNLICHLPIGAARAGLMYVVNEHFFSAYWQNFLVSCGMSAEEAENTANYVISPLVGLSFAILYHLAATKNRIDRLILENFDKIMPAGEKEAEASAQNPETSDVDRIKHCCSNDNISRSAGYGISLMAGVSRVGGQVYAAAEPMITFGIDKRIALTGSLELALEQVINSMDVFAKGVQETLLGYFEYFTKKTPVTTPVASLANSPHSLFQRSKDSMKTPLLNENKENAKIQTIGDDNNESPIQARFLQ